MPKKKPYEKPVMISTETRDVRAIVCSRTDTIVCGSGTLVS